MDKFWIKGHGLHLRTPTTVFDNLGLSGEERKVD